MVVRKGKISLLCGSSFVNSHIVLEKLFKKRLGEESRYLNTTVLYPDKENTVAHIQNVLYTAGFSSLKIVVFKQIHLFPSSVRDFIFDNLDTIREMNHLVFCIDKDETEILRDKKLRNDRLISYLIKKNTISRKKGVANSSLNNLSRAILKKDLNLALYIVESIFSDTKEDKQMLTTKILGFLIKQLQDYISYNDDIARLFLETDRLIKEKGMEPRLSLELLISKLCYCRNKLLFS